MKWIRANNPRQRLQMTAFLAGLVLFLSLYLLEKWGVFDSLKIGLTKMIQHLLSGVH